MGQPLTTLPQGLILTSRFTFDPELDNTAIKYLQNPILRKSKSKRIIRELEIYLIFHSLHIIQKLITDRFVFNYI